MLVFVELGKLGEEVKTTSAGDDILGGVTITARPVEDEDPVVVAFVQMVVPFVGFASEKEGVEMAGMAKEDVVTFFKFRSTSSHVE